MTVTTPTPAIDHQPTGRIRSPRPFYRLFTAATVASTLIGAAGVFIANHPADGGPSQSTLSPLAATAIGPAAKAMMAAASTVSSVMATPPVIDDVIVAVAPVPTPVAAPPATEVPATTAPAPTPADQDAAEEPVDELAAAASDDGQASTGWRGERAASAEAAAAPQPWAPPSTTTTVAAPAAPAPTVPAPEPQPAEEWLSPASSSQFAADLEAQLVALVNAERAAAGLPGMSGHWPIVEVARAWTATMAASGNLAHNPAYASQIWASMSCRTVAENVGYGSSLEQVHAALMQSPGHRANILNPAFNLIGVGVTWDATGLLWLTQNFCG